MDKLSYQLLEQQKYKGYLLKEASERVLQFGEGNFLRAFVEYFIDIMNEKAQFHSKVVLVQPIAGADFIREKINEQEGLYTLFLRGNKDGKQVNEKRVISCVSRCINPYVEFDKVMECAKNPELRFIVCNTTEAGICYNENCRFADKPPASYPAKLVQFLYERFKYFKNEKGKGFVILACELIDNNGKELENCVLQYAKQWKLGTDFINWLKEENIFCSTLVDRIVTGYPKAEEKQLWAELGYEDNVMDTGEIFGFWAIEGPEYLREELPFHKAGLPVVITSDHKPYKERKVRILNGAHTSMVMGAYLAGKNTVRECMEDEVICSFMEKTIYDEIIPFLSLDKEELRTFAKSVTDRFNNPYIEHRLLSISLNSTSKWRTRVLPSLKAYRNGYKEIPACIAASLSFYIAFYRGTILKNGEFIGMRGEEIYKICDDREVQEFYAAHRADDAEHLVKCVLENKNFWGEDLTEIVGLQTCVTKYLKIIENEGCYVLMKQCIGQEV